MTPDGVSTFGIAQRQRGGIDRDSKAAGPAELAARKFRPDIQGLRAVAILLVLLYHADIPRVAGGYVGVDVFFVISGYLITGQLVREATLSGRISVAGFYLRRVRRLLPSAVVVIVATLLVARAFAPPLLSLPLSKDGIFAAVYALNFRLAVQGVDYQNAGAAPSAFQHFWSLGVEEQFYLFWPLLIIAAMMLTRRWWRDLLPVLFAAVVAVSLYISQFLLTTDAPMSYFSVQSRAWEFAAGALVALASVPLARVHSRLRAAMFLGGLALIVAAGVCFDAQTQFPGWHALAPVTGTALVIAAGCGGRQGLEVILGNRAMQWIGQVSYPWYLWHWPVLILVPYIAPRWPHGWAVNLALEGVSLGLAAATYYGLERPTRKPGLRPVVWATAGLALMTCAVGTGAGLDHAISATLVQTAAPATAAAPVDSSTHALFAMASSASPFASKLTSGPVTPSVLDAVSDAPRSPGDCLVGFSAVTSPHCLIGPDGKPTSAPVTSNRVVLLGDSHAAEWYADVSEVARAYGWDVEVLTKEGCPLATISIVNASLNRPYTECGQWRSAMFQRLADEPPPRAVFIASLNYYTSDNSYLAQGWTKTITAVKSAGAPVVYLRDTPFPSTDIPTCVSGALDDWNKCTFPRSTAYHPDPLMAGSAKSHGLAARVDVDKYLCPLARERCPGVLAGVLLYRDDSHVTNTAMTMLRPVVVRQLEPLLKSLRPRSHS